MAGLLGMYTSFLSRRPLVGNMASSAVLFATGDVIAQQAIENKGVAKHDLVRTGRIVAWGSLGFAPIVHVWFKFLQKNVNFSNKWATAGARTAADQLIAAPSIVALFFTTMTLLEGKSLDEAGQKIKSQWLPTLQTNWGVFVPVQLLNMSLVPLQYRLLVINGVNVPWNAYLSLQNQKAEREAEGGVAGKIANKVL